MGISMIVGIVFIAFGLIFLFVNILQIRKAKTAEAWPVASGTILTSDLKERRNYNSKTHRATITYEPQVEYEYTLVGQKYTGKQIAFGNSAYDYDTATNKIEPYPQGAAVQVHYNPDNPSRAVLETKAVGGTSSIITAAFFLIAGLVMIVLKPF